MMKNGDETISLIRRSLKIESFSFGRVVLDERHCTGRWVPHHLFGINQYKNGSLDFTTREGHEYHVPDGRAILIPNGAFLKSKNNNMGKTISLWHRPHISIMESIDISQLLDMPFLLDEENSQKVGIINKELFMLEDIKKSNFLQYTIKQHLLCMQLFDIVMTVSNLKPDITEFLAKVQRAQPVLEYINRNITHTPDSEELAAVLSLSIPRLFCVFKKATGLSPGKYIQQQRMRKAQELLISSEARIYEIANAVGYEDPFYFSRLFKQNFNISPEAYRNTFANNG